jgi:hypothetical protein
VHRVGIDTWMPRAGPKDGTGGTEPDVPPLRVAIVNDYEVIVAGVMAMLAPQRYGVDVVELDVQQNPGNNVDVALFDSYGHPGLGLPRIRSLVADERVGSVAVYTWSLSKASSPRPYLRTSSSPLSELSLAARSLRPGDFEARARGSGPARSGVSRPGRARLWHLWRQECRTAPLLRRCSLARTRSVPISRRSFGNLG